MEKYVQVKASFFGGLHCHLPRSPDGPQGRVQNLCWTIQRISKLHQLLTQRGLSYLSRNKPVFFSQDCLIGLGREKRLKTTESERRQERWRGKRERKRVCVLNLVTGNVSLVLPRATYIHMKISHREKAEQRPWEKEIDLTVLFQFPSFSGPEDSPLALSVW